jgi:gliding motility-associated-like protein
MRIILLFVFFSLHFYKTYAQKHDRIAQNMQVVESGISFVENKKQWHSSIRYRAEIPSGFLDVQNGRLQYFLYDAVALNHRHDHDEKHNGQPFEEEPIDYHSFTIDFLGASPVQAKASDVTPTKYNYYLGNNPQYWADEAKAFHKIAFENLYPKINYYLYSKGNSIKYEFHLEAGADPNQIKMQYNYVSDLRLLPNGNLEIKTTVGTIQEKKPYSYQIIRGKMVEVPTSFVLNGKELSFVFPKGYNKKQPLVIDPDMIFSTYSGSTSSNYGNTATFDNDGNLYAGSTSFGSTLGPGAPTPTNVGSLGGSTNIRLYKYNATGTTLQYVTFIGGSNSEVPHSLVTDGSRLLVFGATGSSDFPTTFGPTFQGGTSASVTAVTYSNGTDMYVVKLNANGTLDRARLLGGSGNEAIKASGLAWTIDNYGDGSRGDIYVDGGGDIFVATNTTSASIAGVSGTIQGGQDALLVKFDNNLNLIFGRYFGGDGLDIALSVKTNAAGDIFIGGGTRSTNLPATAGSIRTTPYGGDDGFVAKFDANGTLIRSTYLGTTNADMVFFIDLDASSNVYAYGQSRGGAYPIFPAAPPSSVPYNNGASGQFIHKITDDLAITEWSTRVGNNNGNYNLSPTAFLVDNCGNIFIAGYGGWSSIPNVTGSPVTPNAFKGTTDGSDFYLAVYRPNMTGLLYGTFVGGSGSEHVDGGTSRFSKEGIVYHAVCAPSGFSTTSGAWSPSTGTTWDCAVFKFETSINANFQMQDPNIGTPISSGGTSCSQTVSFRFPTNVTEYDSFQWQIFDLGGNELFSETVNRDFQYTFNTSGNYKIRLVVSNCAKVAQSVKDLVITIPNFNVSADTEICRFSSVQLQATGAATYRWTPTAGLSNPNIANPVASPNQTTTYTVEMQGGGCTVRKQVKVSVRPATAVDFKFDLIKDCNTPYRVKFSLVNVDSTKLSDFVWDLGDTRVFEGPNPPEIIYGVNGKEYTVTLSAKNPNGCISKVEKKVFIPAPPVFPPNAITPNGDGKNDTFEVAEQGSKIKIWNRWGKIIFQSDDYKNDWGKDVAAGTYYYFLESPSGVNCNGWVQVLK